MRLYTATELGTATQPCIKIAHPREQSIYDEERGLGLVHYQSLKDKTL